MRQNLNLTVQMKRGINYVSPAYAGLTHRENPRAPFKIRNYKKRKENKNNMERLTGISFADVDDKIAISELQ